MAVDSWEICFDHMGIGRVEVDPEAQGALDIVVDTVLVVDTVDCNAVDSRLVDSPETRLDNFAAVVGRIGVD